MISVYWGRFNPPHKGHLQIIKNILKENNMLIIAIGSAQYKNTARNPFSGLERKIMLQAYLKEAGINTKNTNVVTVPDGKSFSKSIKNMFTICGKFDTLYTDKKTIIKLTPKKVTVQKIKRTGTLSSTKIRDAIANDKKWENLTGIAVVKLIKKFDGIKRIKKAYDTVVIP